MLLESCVLVVMVTARVEVSTGVSLEEVVTMMTGSEGNITVVTVVDDDEIDEDDGVGVGMEGPEINEFY